MPLTEAFRNLAQMTEINIATDSSVQGTVSLYLHDVSLTDALNALTKTHGLDYKLIDNTVYIAQQEEIQSTYEQLETEIFKLDNADPEKIKANIDHLVDKGIIKVNERNNSLIVTAYQAQLNQVSEAINRLDYSREQISLQVRFEEVSHSKLDELGIDWKLGSKGGVDTSSNSDADSFKIGNLEFGYQASLELLNNSGASSVIANPRITTLAGEQAHINIGDEIPIIKEESRTNEDGSTETSTEVEYRDVGIDLNILPKVRDEDKIYIDLKPEITTFVDWVEVGGNRYPKTSVKKVETKIEVKDGQTIAIGGLIKETEYETMSKIPLLGDMPALGNLFRSEGTEQEKRELIIFITPEIIDLDNRQDLSLEEDEVKSKIKTESESEDSKGEETTEEKAEETTGDEQDSN
ncbi:MAG: secretin N-terminal domain-containing protein [Bacillota bacterium]